MGIVLGLTAAVFWGTADYFARGATRLVGTYRTLLYMQGVGFVALGGYLLLSGELAALLRTAAPEYWALGALTALLYMVSNLSFYRAFEVCFAMAIVSPIGASYAAITVLLALLSGETLTSLRSIGILLALVGIVLTAADIRSLANGVKPPGGLLGGGVGWAMFASVSYGVTFWLLGFHVAPVLGAVAPVWLVRVVTIVALTLVALVAGKTLRPPPREGWKPILAIGVLDTSAFVANAIGMTTDQVSVVTVLAGLFSAFTVLLSRVFLDERLAPTQWAGIGIIFVSIVLVSL